MNKIKQFKTLYYNSVVYMNIKCFLTIKACNILPSELKCIIWNKIKDDASKVIASRYYLKVNINGDAFLSFLTIRDELILRDMLISDLFYINKLVKNYMYKITYIYIQEPGTWIDILKDILFYPLVLKQAENSNYYDDFIFLGANIDIIINKIVCSNYIYKKTKIAWWEHL